MPKSPILEDILRNSSLDMNISAYHWNRDNKSKLNYNEVNTGIGASYKSGDMTYMVGNYLNSLRKNSNYALAGYTPFNTDTPAGKFGAGVVAGGITGYPLGDVIPALGLLGTWDSKDFGLNLIATPNIKLRGTEVDGFLGLQGRYKIK